MKHLIVGLGSIGRRHFKNLHAIGERDVLVVEKNKKHDALQKEILNAYHPQVFYDINDALRRKPDTAFVTNPTSVHGKTAFRALQNGAHVFIEKPISHTLHGVRELLALAKKKKKMIYVGYHFRHHPQLLRVKRMIEKGVLGTLFYAHFSTGEYLPDWHPWEDYRKVYFSKKETGACREMLPFELSWLDFLVGSDVADIRGFVGKLSQLEMTADDCMVAGLRYTNGVLGSIMVDVLARNPFRTLKLIGSESVIRWEWLENTITLYDAATKEETIVEVPKGNPETGYLAGEEMYIEEMKSFIDAICGRAPYPYTFAEDWHRLKLLYALEAQS